MVSVCLFNDNRLPQLGKLNEIIHIGAILMSIQLYADFLINISINYDMQYMDLKTFRWIALLLKYKTTLHHVC